MVNFYNQGAMPDLREDAAFDYATKFCTSAGGGKRHLKE